MLDLLALAKKPAPTIAPAPATQPNPAPPAQPTPIANPFEQLKQTANGFALRQPDTVPTAPGAPPSIASVANQPVAQVAQQTGPVDLAMGEFPNQTVNTDEEAVSRFQQMLEYLKTHLASHEIANNLADTLKFLETHTFLTETMKPADIQTFVRTMRAAYGTVIAKKTERSTKRAVSNEKVEEVLGELADLDF